MKIRVKRVVFLPTGKFEGYAEPYISVQWYLCAKQACLLIESSSFGFWSRRWWTCSWGLDWIEKLSHSTTPCDSSVCWVFEIRILEKQFIDITYYYFLSLLSASSEPNVSYLLHHSIVCSMKVPAFDQSIFHIVTILKLKSKISEEYFVKNNKVT